MGECKSSYRDLGVKPAGFEHLLVAFSGGRKSEIQYICEHFSPEKNCGSYEIRLAFSMASTTSKSDLVALVLKNERVCTPTFCLQLIKHFVAHAYTLLPLLFFYISPRIWRRVLEYADPFPGALYDEHTFQTILVYYFPQFFVSASATSASVSGSAFAYRKSSTVPSTIASHLALIAPGSLLSSSSPFSCECSFQYYLPHIDAHMHYSRVSFAPHLLCIRLVEVCIALCSLDLPPYVLLDIIEFLPNFVYLISPSASRSPAYLAFGHKQRIERVVRICEIGKRKRRVVRVEEK